MMDPTLDGDLGLLRPMQAYLLLLTSGDSRENRQYKASKVAETD